ncbi:MAG: type II toxin-antitoxin system RelE/ParE family toxin [Flavobacteriales bacterium]|nr:type II toxin-antitoxin system RelE/ParE family toxin [Flavobacteriales bacterium]MCB0793118.1 type II toxin-antitoxin system RelE/ParE family toxin [Flavobacteriales bacterium]
MTLKVSQAAADDLEGIWLYTVEHWSVEQADRYLSRILDTFHQILLAPGDGKDFGHVRSGYRAMKAGSHLIFYRSDEASGAVEIIRVLHGRMDLDNRLDP